MSKQENKIKAIAGLSEFDKDLSDEVLESFDRFADGKYVPFQVIRIFFRYYRGIVKYSPEDLSGVGLRSVPDGLLIIRIKLKKMNNQLYGKKEDRIILKIEEKDRAIIKNIIDTAGMLESKDKEFSDMFS